MRTNEFIPEYLLGHEHEEACAHCHQEAEKACQSWAKAMGMPVRTMVKKARAMSANTVTSSAPRHLLRHEQHDPAAEGDREERDPHGHGDYLRRCARIEGEFCAIDQHDPREGRDQLL